MHRSFTVQVIRWTGASSSKAMKLNNSGSLALALASTSLVPNSLITTAFSLNVQVARGNNFGIDAPSYSSLQTKRTMSTSKMDQSFKTWSFDEPCKTMAWTELSSATIVPAAKSDGWNGDADLVIVGVFAPKKDGDDDEEEETDDKKEEEEEEPATVLVAGAQEIDGELGGALTNLMVENAKEFKHGAKAGSKTPTLRLYTDGRPQRYVVVGLGQLPDEEDDEEAKQKKLDGVGAALGKTLASLCDSEKKVKTAKFLVPASIATDGTVLQDMSTAFYTSLYSDNRFRTGKKVKEAAKDLETLTLVVDGASDVDGMDVSLEAGKKLATGVFMAKDIVNSPHNVLNSESLADTAKRVAEESNGVLKCTILGKKECEERGMGAYLGVARASETEPQFIHLSYTPADGKVNKKIGVIGKGLLFDTGGYNIKTGMMELMKFDCGGAAAVIGTHMLQKHLFLLIRRRRCCCCGCWCRNGYVAITTFSWHLPYFFCCY